MKARCLTIPKWSISFLYLSPLSCNRSSKLRKAKKNRRFSGNRERVWQLTILRTTFTAKWWISDKNLFYNFCGDVSGLGLAKRIVLIGLVGAKQSSRYHLFLNPPRKTIESIYWPFLNGKVLFYKGVYFSISNTYHDMSLKYRSVNKLQQIATNCKLSTFLLKLELSCGWLKR